jgi:hypothetical protein
MSNDPHRDKLVSNVASLEKYIDNLLTVAHPTRVQARKLLMYQDRLPRAQRALIAYDENPDPRPIEFIHVGPAPLPNNSVPDGQTFGCPDGFDVKDFEARYGFSVQTAFNKVATDILRPPLHGTQGDLARQTRMIDYFAGKIPFSRVAGDFGAWYQRLGCDVDITAIHDLGA